MTRTLHIAEIPYESGELEFRYSRYLSDEGKRWIKDGLFQRYYKTGQLASEGQYQDGKEHGLWRDYHENGQLAAEGSYHFGEKLGKWVFLDCNGNLESETTITKET